MSLVIKHHFYNFSVYKKNLSTSKLKLRMGEVGGNDYIRIQMLDEDGTVMVKNTSVHACTPRAHTDLQRKASATYITMVAQTFISKEMFSDWTNRKKGLDTTKRFFLGGISGCWSYKRKRTLWKLFRFVLD